MSSENATLGSGAVVRVGQGEIPEWTKIRGVMDFQMPSNEVADIDTTNHDSGDYKEYMPGLIDAGDWTVSHLYKPGSDEDLMFETMSATRQREVVQLEVTPKGGTPKVYVGYLKRYDTDLPVEEKMTADAVFKIIGKI